MIEPTVTGKILATARAEIGYRESPAGSNLTKYGAWYGLDGQPWCAMFVSWVFHNAGCPLPQIQDKAPSGGAYCPYFENYARRNEQWAASPRPGDLVLYHFGKHLAVHIGIVETVESGGKFFAIEGNTAVGNQANGGMVMRRSRSLNQVRGFYRPLVLDQNKTPKDLFWRNISLKKPYLSGHDVRAWQKQASWWGMPIKIDGIYGPKSEKICMELQKTWGLDVDGIVGPKTWARTFLPSSEG